MNSPVGAIRKHLVLAAVCAAFFVCGLLRLNDLSAYTPDSCRYLIWGNSLAHGHGYVDATQPDPDKFVVHAPLYALLIAPVELVFPMSLVAVKVWTLLWGVLALVLFYFWVLRVFGKTAALCATLLFGLNPAMLFFSTEVLSEAPFVAFVLALFLLMEQLPANEPGKKGALLLFVPLLALLPLLRETGIAMVAAVALVLFSRRNFKRAAIVLGVFVVVFGSWYVRNQILVVPKAGSQIGNLALITQHFVTPPGAPIANEFALRVWLALKTYAGEVGGLIYYPLFTRQLSELVVEPSGAFRFAAALLEGGKYLILVAAIPLMLTGIAADFRNSPSASERGLFAGIYLLAICAYPVHDIRFLLPLCPLVYYYSLGGVISIARQPRIPSFLRTGPAIAAAVILLLLPNITALTELVRTNLEYRSSPQAMLQHPTVPAMFRFQWQKLKTWLDANVPDSAVIASPIKDAVVIAGGRKVLEIDHGTTLPWFESLLRDYHVEYLLAPPRWLDLREFEFLMRESRRFWFEPLPDAPNLMRVHSRFLEPGVLSPPHRVFDTLRVTEILRNGRNELVHGRYESARTLLASALRLAPGSGDVLYQVMVADLMLGDSVSAQRVYQSLLGQTQSYSYVALARGQFDAADLLARAKASTMFEEQGVKTNKAASIYWKSGYYRRAADLMDTLMVTDTSYFVGLLWGFHYELQLGDTATARTYLTILENLDKRNAVVQAFGHILRIGDSLKVARSAAERSALHLSAAGVFRVMQLPEESVDEAEMALREEPGNVEALLFLARAFELRSRPRRSIELYGQVLRLDGRNHLATAKLDSLRTALSRN